MFSKSIIVREETIRIPLHVHNLEVVLCQNAANSRDRAGISKLSCLRSNFFQVARCVGFVGTSPKSHLPFRDIFKGFCLFSYHNPTDNSVGKQQKIAIHYILLKSRSRATRWARQDSTVQLSTAAQNKNKPGAT